jgi:DNA (cytosine-5)-methyltransferase 1
MAVEEVFGAELAWVSEWEAAPSKILKHHWPHVPNYGDVTKIDWTAIEPVDIISGGSPCQDLSMAGKRRGMTEGTRSNLWESMREGIATIKPKYVVWENVRGALSAEATSVSDMGQREGFLGERGGHLRALGRVLGDLADLGYDAEWRGLRASDVGAPHGRYRVFILASDTMRSGSRGRATQPEPTRRDDATLGSDQGATSAHRNDLGINRAGERAEQDGRGQLADGRIAPTNTNHAGPQGQHHTQGTSQAERHRHSGAGVDWRQYTGAVRRWEALHRAAPSPVEMSPTGKPRLSAAFAEWMMGLPEGWVTDVPGVRWSDQLKACGNGVVPQQAVAALRDMLAAFEGQERVAA